MNARVVDTRWTPAKTRHGIRTSEYRRTSEARSGVQSIALTVASSLERCCRESHFQWACNDVWGRQLQATDFSRCVVDTSNDRSLRELELDVYRRVAPVSGNTSLLCGGRAVGLRALRRIGRQRWTVTNSPSSRLVTYESPSLTCTTRPRKRDSPSMSECAAGFH